jgi:phosphohistidine phosphatase
MDLILIRHAEATPRGSDGIADEDRPLTDAGHAQAKALAAALKAHHIHVNKVVTSPLLRARQTAEGLVESWSDPKPELLDLDDLEPGGKPKKVTRHLMALEGDAIAVVGHEPDLTTYVGWLIGEKKVQLELAKSGAAVVHFDGTPAKGAGVLTLLLTPTWYEVAAKPAGAKRA